MEKRTAFILIILGLLAIVVLIEVFFYFKNTQQLQTKSPIPTPIVESTSPPTELTSNFDPRHDEAVFTVESIDAPHKILNLKAIYPASFEGAEVSSEITCQDNDIKIFSNITQNNENQESVTLEAFFARLQKETLKNVVFSGLCSDTVCNEINSNCQLSINPK